MSQQARHGAAVSRHPRWPCRTMEGKEDWLQRNARLRWPAAQTSATRTRQCMQPAAQGERPGPGCEQGFGQTQRLEPTNLNAQHDKPAAATGGKFRYVRALARSATRKTAPPSRHGRLVAVKGDTRVVSTASCSQARHGTNTGARVQRSIGAKDHCCLGKATPGVSVMRGGKPQREPAGVERESTARRATRRYSRNNHETGRSWTPGDNSRKTRC